MPFTEQEAIDMRQAIKDLENKEAQEARTQFNIDKTRAENWFNTLGIDIQGATTRRQALTNFNDILALLEIETERFRQMVLKEKEVEANEKYKEIKRIG